MGRTVSGRPRRREGRGLGEIMSESLIFIMIGVGLVAAGYWYFAIYRNSPQVALQHYIAAVNSGNVDAQYAMLSDTAKKWAGSQSNYADKWPLAYGLSARVAQFTFSNSQQNGDSWTTDVNMSVLKQTTSLLATGSTKYIDHYVMVKQPDGWKVELEKCRIDTSQARQSH